MGSVESEIVQGGHVESFRRDGYVVVRQLLDPVLCDLARRAFDAEIKPYRGYLYRQTTGYAECHKFTSAGYVENPILNIQDVSRNLFDGFWQAGMNVVANERLVEFSRLIIGEQVRVVQSMYFEGNPATWPHQDTYYLDSADFGRMVGAWIALEDIAEGAGRFFVYPGSHLVSLPKNAGSTNYAFQHETYKQFVSASIDESQLQMVAPALCKGDVLFWSSRTIHGSLSTIDPDKSRSSITVHFIPASRPFMQFQSREKTLYLKRIGGVEVHCPKSQDKALNRALLWFESSYPRVFRATKRLAIKMITR